MVYPSGMKRKKLNLSSLPITLKYGGMQGKIAESTFKSQRTRFLSSQPTDYQYEIFGEIIFLSGRITLIIVNESEKFI